MKVLLVYPRSVNAFTTLEGGFRIAPGLLYVAEATRAQGHTVRLAIADVRHLIRELKRFQPDVLGVSSITASYPAAVRLVRAAKQHSPETVTVMGGIHVTFLPEKAMAESGVDYVIRGEGEAGFPQLLRALETGEDVASVPGLCYRKGTAYVIGDITYVADLDALPYPSHGLVPHRAVLEPFVYSSRGCPNRCAFCTIPRFYGGKVRTRSVDFVIDEITRLEKAGYKHFLFQDDNFTANPERVEAICDRMIDRGIHIKWGCQATLAMVAEHPDVVRKMAKAGCSSMTIGIESGISEVLASYHKPQTVYQAHEAIRFMKSTKITDFWYFMFGSADQYDTEEYWEANAEYLFSIDIDLANISLLTPYPGTEMYERLSAANRIVEPDWEKWDSSHCVYQPEGASRQRLEHIYSETLRKFYVQRSPIRNIKAIAKATRCGRYSVRGTLAFLALVAAESARRRKTTRMAS